VSEQRGCVSSGLHAPGGAARPRGQQASVELVQLRVEQLRASAQLEKRYRPVAGGEAQTLQRQACEPVPVPQRRACARFMFRASAPIRKVFSTSDSGGMSCGGGTEGATAAAGAVMADGSTQVGRQCSTACSQGLVHAEGRGSGCDADAASRATLLPSSTRVPLAQTLLSQVAHRSPMVAAAARVVSTGAQAQLGGVGGVLVPGACALAPRAASNRSCSCGVTLQRETAARSQKEVRFFVHGSPLSRSWAHADSALSASRSEAISACHTPGEASFPAARLRRA